MVGEIVTGVRIALGSAPVDACGSMDTDGDGRVEVGEIIAAVNDLICDCRSCSEQPVVAIRVTPLNPAIAVGTSVQLTATATLADGSTSDVTQRATWLSAQPGNATVGNAAGSKGLVTAHRTGSSAITALDPETGILGGTSTLDRGGYFLDVRNVRLGGDSTSVSVSPGQTVSLSFDFTIWSRSGCPGCIDWIAAGIAGDGQTAHYVGIPGRSPGQTGSARLTLRAPGSAGSYTAYASLSPVFTQRDAIRQYESEFPGPTTGPGFIPLGTIRVTGAEGRRPG